MNQTRTSSFRAKLLLPLAGTLAAVLLALGLAVTRTRDTRMRNEVVASAASAEHLFAISLREEAEHLESTIVSVLRDRSLVGPWKARDRTSLLRSTHEFFEHLRARFYITHWYFHDLDGVNFLRVHQPMRHGDRVERHTLRRARETGRVASGIELGPLGTFTLRVVMPWIVDGERVGYVELGKEIEHITQRIRRALDIDLSVAVRKDFIDKARWEAGMRMLGRDPDWSEHEAYVMTDTGIRWLGLDIRDCLASPDAEIGVGATDPVPAAAPNGAGGRDYRISTFPLTDAGGADVGRMIVVSDVTAELEESHALVMRTVGLGFLTAMLVLGVFWVVVSRLEEDLRESDLALEARCLDLADARRRADAANVAKGEFLANMSHEIRTPMTAILGFSDTLLDEGLESSARREAVTTIRRNGEHLLCIINDILDLSKVDAGKMVIEKIACSPTGVLAEVGQLVRVRAEAKGIQLIVEIGEGIPERVLTDATRLRQILTNLVANAIKFTKVGNATVSLSFQRVDGEDRLAYDVTDTGIGMDEEAAARVFQTFEQADSSTTRIFGGTGLGLAISKRLANLLGGDIVLVASEPGKGSRFRVRIPAELPASPNEPVTVATVGSLAESAQAAEVSSPGKAASEIDGMRILLAEDGPDNRLLITHVLAREGAHVAIAENGREAMDAIEHAEACGTPFELVIMDMQMPVMDGYEATRKLRSSGCELPIIALTANVMTGDRERCLEAGCSDYATKPLERSELLAAIRALRPGRASHHSEC